MKENLKMNNENGIFFRITKVRNNPLQQKKKQSKVLK